MVIEYPKNGDMPELFRLWQLAFADPRESIDAFFASAFSSERCRCLRVEDRIGAVLYWLDVYCGEEKYAYLYGVATHPDFRGRGLCRALMADTHALLSRQGYAGSLLVPQQEGLRKMYASFGYEDIGGVAEFSREAGETAADLRVIGPGEYARLRRQYLPEGGAVQEGENIRYLSTYARYCVGEDFLLAFLVEGEKLLGIELLGNADAVPGILKALGCSRGSFRTPGNTRPFAMGLFFREGAKRPSYFGLAFD